MRRLVTSLALVAAACHKGAPPCPDAALSLTPTAREHVTAALAGAPWTRETLATLDAYATAWNATYKRACATPLRQRCLFRARDRFDALVDQLTPPLDEGGRSNAPLVAATLPSLDECDHMTDEAQLAIPASPADRARTEMFEHDLSRAWAAFGIGRFSAAKTIVDADMLGLSKLKLPRLSAETLSIAAAVEAATGDLTAARARFDEALAAAKASASPAVVERVWLAYLRLEVGTSSPQLASDVATARATFTRPELDLYAGAASLAAGNAAEAEALITRAVDAPNLRFDERSTALLGLASIALAHGDPARAIERLTSARDVLLPVVGGQHPMLARFEDVFAEAERMRGQLRASLAHSDRALSLTTMPRSFLVRAATYLEAGDIANARSDATKARDLGATRDANRLLGDILTANGNADEAKAYYDLAGVPPTPPPALPADAATLAARAKALPNEPSRTALATWIALAYATTGDEATRAARAAIALYQAMPQLGRGRDYDAMWALAKSL